MLAFASAAAQPTHTFEDVTNQPTPTYPSYMPPKGMVPDERTASAIADAVLSAVYGADLIKSEEPFRIKLEGDRWIVTGRLWCAPLCFGGVATIHISKSDGRILYLIHTK